MTAEASSIRVPAFAAAQMTTQVYKHKHEANARAIQQVGAAINAPGGINAVNLKVAELYVAAFANLAKTGNTLIVPSNLADVASLVTSVTTMLKAQPK